MTQTKYEVDLESYFDLHFFYPISEFLMPIFKAWSFTPNVITALSCITVAIATYYLFIDTRIAAIFLLTSYIFDCADGMFARRYNMTSPFGAAFDYTKDTIMNTIFGVSLLLRYTSFYNLNFWTVLALTLLAWYPLLMGLLINETLFFYRKHNETDYYSHKKKLFKKNNVAITVYLGLSKFLYTLSKPYIKDPEQMVANAKRFRQFGLGNIFMFVFIFLNIFVIV